MFNDMLSLGSSGDGGVKTTSDISGLTATTLAVKTVIYRNTSTTYTIQGDIDKMYIIWGGKGGSNYRKWSDVSLNTMLVNYSSGNETLKIQKTATDTATITAANTAMMVAFFSIVE